MAAGTIFLIAGGCALLPLLAFMCAKWGFIGYVSGKKFSEKFFNNERDVE